MIAAAGGVSQVKREGSEVRIFPKTEKHFRQMRELEAPHVRAMKEHSEAIQGGWITERYRLPNGETRLLPAGSGDANPALIPVRNYRGIRVNPGEQVLFSSGHTHLNDDPAEWQRAECPACKDSA